MSRRVSRRIIPFLGNTFSPGSAPGAVGWWRADQGITLGTGVSSWTDILGLSAALTQGTGASQPTYTASDAQFGGKPSLTGDGVSMVLTSTSVPTAGSATIFVWMVQRLITAAANGCWATFNTGSNWEIRQDNGGVGEPQVINIITGQFGAIWGSGIAGSTKPIYGYTSGTQTGVNVDNGTEVNAAVTASTFPTTSMALFGRSALFINAKIAEILVTTQLPNAAFLANLQTYAQRYGAI